MTLWTPSYLTLANAYSARSDRVTQELLAKGPGVPSIADLVVSQRAAGANYSVDVSAGWASIRHTTLNPGGLYGVYNDGVVNVANPNAANGSNPRIDLLSVQVKDVTDSGDASNTPLFVWTAGTATAGATLANLSGKPAAPANSLSLAYVLIATGATSIVTANLLDVSLCPIRGVSTFANGVDTVQPDYPRGLPVAAQISAGSYGSAVRIHVPRRTTVTNLRWKYTTGASAPSGGVWTFAIYPTWGGAPLFYTASTAYSLFATAQLANNVAMTATGSNIIEPGNYLLWFGSTLTGNAVVTLGSQCSFSTSTFGSAPAPGIAWTGSSAALQNPWSGMTDANTASGLSVGSYYVVPSVSIGS